MRWLSLRPLSWGVHSAILSLYGACFYAIYASSQGESLLDWAEVGGVLRASFWQAGLSAVLSILFGVLLARACYYSEFRGKQTLYALLSFAWVLPNLVVILALMGIWGQAGWLSQLFGWLGGEWNFSLYGLNGILLGHLFLNVPFASHFFLQQLEQISGDQHRLATQLRLRGWQFFRIVELPAIRAVLPYTFWLIFMLCFTSFAIVLTLGGGPQFSTLEVLIYQAVTFESDFAKAATLAMVQTLLGVAFMLLIEKRLNPPRYSNAKPEPDYQTPPTKLARLGHAFVLLNALFWIGLPLLNVVVDALSHPQLGQVLQAEMLWQASAYSLGLSLLAATLALGFALVLLLEVRKLRAKEANWGLKWVQSSLYIALIVPSFVLSVGLFLWLLPFELGSGALLWIVAVCNALAVLPYVSNLLNAPLWDAWANLDPLCQQLRLTGWARWRIVEWRLLKRPLLRAFVMAMVTSLGNFTVIAFFGTQDFTALPQLLYQQVGHYRGDDASVTALVLMLLTFALFMLQQRLARVSHDNEA